MQSKAVNITYKGATITAKVISELIAKYLQGIEKQTYGKQNLKKLNRKGKALDSIPVINEDLKGLKKELKKYGVDYSVRKSLSEKDTYDVYFKGSDITQIQTALKNYMARSFHQQRERPSSIKERMIAAVQKAKERGVSHKERVKKFEKGRDER